MSQKVAGAQTPNRIPTTSADATAVLKRTEKKIIESIRQHMYSLDPKTNLDKGGYYLVFSPEDQPEIICKSDVSKMQIEMVTMTEKEGLLFITDTKGATVALQQGAFSINDVNAILEAIENTLTGDPEKLPE